MKTLSIEVTAQAIALYVQFGAIRAIKFLMDSGLSIEESIDILAIYDEWSEYVDSCLEATCGKNTTV